MDNVPVVSHKHLCLMWSYLGGDVHFAFTWSVVSVVVVVIYVGAAVFSLVTCGGVVCVEVSLFPTVPGGVMCCVLVTMSFEVVVPV